MVSGSVSKVELSWEDVASDNFPPTPRQLFATAVLAEAAKTKAAMPHANGRVERARDLVLAGLVISQPDYSFAVRSESAKGKTYVVKDNVCECPDALKVEGGRCKHLLATWIWRKARRAVEAQADSTPDATADDMPDPVGPQASPAQPHTPAPVAAVSQLVPEASGIPPEFIVQIQGKSFVMFAGLLAMAHERGLMSLKADLVTVTPELAIAHAVATFKDGRTFAESADATPQNVNAKIRPHFPRMSLTRAKARALRDALNISMSAVEELEG